MIVLHITYCILFQKFDNNRRLVSLKQTFKIRTKKICYFFPFLAEAASISSSSTECVSLRFASLSALRASLI